jgi:hypothetical protein
MKTTITFLVFFLVLHSININAQNFVESECGIIYNPSYTYENYQGSNFELGYRLYHNNILIRSGVGTQPGRGYQIALLKFVDDSTGFMITSSKQHSVLVQYYIYKIIGNKFILLWDTYNTFNLFIVNANLAYLSTYLMDFILVRCSDIQPSKQLTQNRPTSDITIIDTIIGMPLCQNLSEINLRYDTVNCKILFHIIDSTYSIIENGISPWKVFPNPADDYICLNTNNPLASCMINIFNSLGIMQKSIVFNQLSGQTIYVGDLKKGLYIVEINQGKIKYYHKMIKT